MRLLIALPDEEAARSVRDEMESELWEAVVVRGGQDVLHELAWSHYDILLIHQCLPQLDGRAVLALLSQQRLCCPPRVLFVRLLDGHAPRPPEADGCAPAGAYPSRLCALLRIIAQKPLPKLAAANAPGISGAVETFLSDITLGTHYKGREYIAWLLKRMTPSPIGDTRPLGEWYRACAGALDTTPAAVERCVRVAVESVFMQGDMRGIERYFGATVDPEKGKPTNRAFLLQSVHQLRLMLGHSLTDARSPNSSVMHHSPAAPTSV